jgi:hypothetical protein
MKVFKNLPENLTDRIAALTPAKIKSLDVSVFLIDDNDRLSDVSKHTGYYKKTVASLKCKITGKVRSIPVKLRSGKAFGETILASLDASTQENMKSLVQSAKWTMKDVYYDCLLHAILLTEISNDEVNGEYCPEMLYSCTNVVIVINDFYDKQYVGWFFYNKNLDSILYYNK